MVNGGHMPVWEPALTASGLPPELTSTLHIKVAGTGADFMIRLVPFADIIPIPLPIVRNVASVGDLFLTAGLGFFLFATLLRTPAQTQAAIDEAKTGRYLGISGTAHLPWRSRGAPDEPDAGAPADAGAPGARRTAASRPRSRGRPRSSGRS